MVRPSLSYTVKQFFSPETIIPFLIGSVALGVSCNAGFQFLYELLGADRWAAATIVGVSIALLIVMVWLVRRRLAVRLSSAVKAVVRSPRPSPGLIVLVNREEPATKAILHHRQQLKKCWLICSEQSRQVANKLRSLFVEACTPEPIVIHDVQDPLEVKYQVDRIYDGLTADLTADDVICDCTGLTAIASIGMGLACFAGQRRLQYTPAHYGDHLDKAAGSLDPVEIVLQRYPKNEAESKQTPDA